MADSHLTGRVKRDYDARMRTGNRQKFGAHLSVAGGLHNAFYEAVRVGADCVQIFVKNQRQWQAKPLEEPQIREFAAARKQTGVGPVIAHASYLLNLASSDSMQRRKSIAALIDELERCEALCVTGLVIHPGAHLGEGIDAGIRRIAQSLDEVHAATKGFRSRVLLETTAGQGTTIGHEIEHLGRIIDGSDAPERLGVCLDTCHLFAAGYDLREVEDYERTIHELKLHVGLKRVICIHVNDSKGECGGRLDRHEHITKGRIGKRGFARVVNDRRLYAVPMILETPKGQDGRGTDLDVVNMRRLRKLIGSSVVV